uniref:Uncharacterized protein n=1 Tax=Anguilla anguilla TaxID=7936 RepID=A0A0E9VQN1_ANGAN
MFLIQEKTSIDYVFLCLFNSDFTIIMLFNELFPHI